MTLAAAAAPPAPLFPADPTPIPRDPVLVLRDYQGDAIGHVRRAIARGERDFYITLPTGTGKAVILAYVARDLARRGRVLVIVHTKELVHQLAEKLRLVFPDHEVGIVMNIHDDPTCRIVVACVATLRAGHRLQRVLSGSPDPVAALLIDECHHATQTNTYGQIARRVRVHSPRAVVMGCTATPYRHDRQRMQDLLPSCVFARDIADMQSAGWLAPLTWQRVRLDVNLADLPTSRIDGETDYAPGVLAVALNSPPINAHIARATAPVLVGRRVLVFGADVAHAHALAAAYEAEGITAATIWGDMPPRDRDATLAAWRAGGVQAVSNCQILTEGFDYPAISAIVIARPTQSLARYMQMIGRGTRLAPDKTNCLIIDCVGNEDITDTKQIVLPDVMPVTASDDPEDAPDGSPASDRETGPRKPREHLIYLIDPRHDARYAWQYHKPSRSYFLRLDESRICVLSADPDRSGLYRLAITVYGAPAPDQRPITRGSWIADISLPLPEIRAHAAAWIEEHARIWISHKDRFWRSQAPTEKQLAYLATIAPATHAQALAEHWTRGKVAATLDLSIFGRFNAPILRRMWNEVPA